MKKITLLMIVLIMVLLAGCGDKKTNTNDTDNKEINSAENSNNGKESSENSKSGINVSLKDQELLNSIKPNAIEKVLIEGTSVNEGITVNTKTIVYKENLRYESSGTNGEQIMIYNADEATTYMYNPVDKTGTKFADGEEEADDMGMDISSGSDLLSEIEGLVKAEITNVNNMEALYIETQSDTGAGIYTTKQWISTRYWHPIKTEMYFNDQLKSKYETTNITENFKLDKNLFVAPADINFMDFDSMLDGIGEMNMGE